MPSAPVLPLQVIKLVTEVRERHHFTLAAMTDLLHLLKVLLPTNVLPATLYLWGKMMRRVLTASLGPEASGFRRIHLCPNPTCTHNYMHESEDTSACPSCSTPRYMKREQRKVPVQQVRYLGLLQGLRTLMVSRRVCQSVQEFDLASMVDSYHSVYSSEVSETLCNLFIPEYQAMDDGTRREYKLRFFRTGQVCTAAQMEVHVSKVASGDALETRLLVVEGGCDAFQPFKRRQHSTWVHAYRLVGIDWHTQDKGSYEAVTAICDGASEAKAVHLVAALDAQQLLELCPKAVCDYAAPPDAIGASPACGSMLQRHKCFFPRQQA